MLTYQREIHERVLIGCSVAILTKAITKSYGPSVIENIFDNASIWILLVCGVTYSLGVRIHPTYWGCCPTIKSLAVLKALRYH